MPLFGRDANISGVGGNENLEAYGCYDVICKGWESVGGVSKDGIELFLSHLQNWSPFDAGFHLVSTTIVVYESRNAERARWYYGVVKSSRNQWQKRKHGKENMDRHLLAARSSHMFTSNGLALHMWTLSGFLWWSSPGVRWLKFHEKLRVLSDFSLYYKWKTWEVGHRYVGDDAHETEKWKQNLIPSSINADTRDTHGRRISGRVGRHHQTQAADSPNDDDAMLLRPLWGPDIMSCEFLHRTSEYHESLTKLPAVLSTGGNSKGGGGAKEMGKSLSERQKNGHKILGARWPTCERPGQEPWTSGRHSGKVTGLWGHDAPQRPWHSMYRRKKGPPCFQKTSGSKVAVGVGGRMCAGPGWCGGVGGDDNRICAGSLHYHSRRAEWGGGRIVELFGWSKGVQVVEIALSSSFQIHHDVIHERRVIPVVKRVNKGLRRHRLYIAQLARGQCDFPCKIKHKSWPWDEKIRGDGPMRMIGVQLLVSEDSAVSQCTNRGSKGITFTYILPPVQKSEEFKKRSLEVSKDLNKISPSSEVLLEPVEGFESPGVCLHWPLDGGKRSVGGDSMEWILQGHLDRLPFGGHLLEQLWTDNMAISFEGMSSPHRLLNRASKDIGWNRVTSGAKWDPGKGWTGEGERGWSGCWHQALRNQAATRPQGPNRWNKCGSLLSPSPHGILHERPGMPPSCLGGSIRPGQTRNTLGWRPLDRYSRPPPLPLPSDDLRPPSSYRHCGVAEGCRVGEEEGGAGREVVGLVLQVDRQWRDCFGTGT
ncbi:hypothetical protein EDB83DRAFT_2320286 [Lactarius deliciosus]|nr:hypothetical protein EDB83DRAFT_2320286 [Lactarius deliciosus]